MHRNLSITLAFAALLMACSAASGSEVPANVQPNIIVIVSDDQGYADAGFQGSKVISTPNLDAMAKEGVICTRAYVTAPVCSPSRAGLLTGRYQEKFGHHNNIVGDAALPIAHLPLTETLLPQTLAKAGYYTAMVGKWHLGLQNGCTPRERGFDEFFGFTVGGHDYFINHPDELPINDSSYKARIEHNGVGVKVDGYLTDAFGSEAVRIVREKRDKPLFLYLAFNAPHTPTQAPEALVSGMNDELKGKQRRTYAAQIAAMDSNIGQLHAALKETGQDKNTFLVFFSDNGGADHPFYDNTPLRGHKGGLYEGGIRVPFLAMYPGHIPAGGTNGQVITTLDVFATACALAGAKLPAQTDSADMLPLLSGASASPTHKALFWKFPGFGAAVSSGSLKLVVPKNGTPQLFDLAADIGEQNDLAPSRPADVAQLSQMLKEWDSTTVTPLWGPGSNAKTKTLDVSTGKATAHTPINGDLFGETPAE